MNTLFLAVVLVLAGCASSEEENRAFWFREGQKALQDAIKLRPNVGVAKNVIMFLGDGMGMPTITAARILKGQMDGGTGEEYRLQMEKFPFTGLVKTYNTNQQTPDSAGTGTAYWSGVKTRAGVLGVDQTVEQGDCSMMPQAAVDTILNWSIKEGKSVGLVSTSRITHASPGAGYAKIPHRDWENDAEMKDVNGCDKVKDIARQLVEDNHNIKVLLGGGRENFLSKEHGGKREDGLNLIQKWKDTQKSKGAKYYYAENSDELKTTPADTDYLFGLFNMDHMKYDADRNKTGPDSEPSVSEMFEKAYQVLRKNDKGFFLFVEGGRIDHAHHKNLAHQALLDTIAFDKAINSAVRLTSEADTLVLATADHSHVFTMAGYPIRGHNIVDKMTYKVYPKKSKTPLDKMPMSVLMYANGPGPQRTNLTDVDTTDKDFVFPNGVPTKSETHAGEDVAVFARGPMSHLVGGVHEQNVLAHIMAYASCVGPDKSLCIDDAAARFCRRDQARGVPGHSNALQAGWVKVIAGLSLALFVVGRS